MNNIEFNYDTINGAELNIIGTYDGNHVHFTPFLDGKKFPRKKLDQLDIKNIESFIIDNSEEDLDYESDFYERQND